MTPTFIVGSGASGTTLLADLLGLHPEISPLYELPWLPAVLEGANLHATILPWAANLPHLPDSKRPHEHYHHGAHYVCTTAGDVAAILDSTSNVAEAVHRIAAAHVRREGKDAGRFVVKCPALVHHLDRLLEVFPHAQVVEIRRGRDATIASMLARPWAPNKIGDCAALVASARIAGGKMRSAHPDSLCVVDYEDLLQYPAATLSRVLSFMGLCDAPDAILHRQQIPFDLSRRFDTPPILTLCMIVRDEEALLPDCLASVADLVDQIVVVDTGSTDRTVEIAEAAGAAVIRHQWTDDFAHARNIGIRAADGDWILVLDADERLQPGSATAIRAAIADGIDCGLLPLQHVDRHGVPLNEPGFVARLYRNGLDLCYTGCIHEDTDEWIARQTRVEPVAMLPIVHYGYDPQIANNRNKQQRNRRMLQCRAEQEPGNATVWVYLAYVYVRSGETDAAQDASDRAWALRQDAATATLRCRLACAEGDVARLDETLAVDCASHPNLVFYNALNHLMHAEAAAGAERCAHLQLAAQLLGSLHGRPQTSTVELEVGIFGERSLRYLAATVVQLGQWESAQALYRALPLDIDARLGIVEALIGLGDSDAAELQLIALSDAPYPDLPALWCCWHRHNGHHEQAERAAASARANPQAGWLAPHRRRFVNEPVQ